MTKETLLHATDLYTTIQKIEQLLTIFEKNSIEEVKVRGFDWKPSTEQETRIRTAILADQREELERLKAELGRAVTTKSNLPSIIFEKEW